MVELTQDLHTENPNQNPSLKPILLSKLVDLDFDYTGIKVSGTEIYKHRYSEVRAHYTNERIVQAYTWSGKGDKILNIVVSGITPETLEDRLIKKPRFFPPRPFFGLL